MRLPGNRLDDVSVALESFDHRCKPVVNLFDIETVHFLLIVCLHNQQATLHHGEEVMDELGALLV